MFVGGRRVFSISWEVERAFSAREEAAAARARGCDVDGGGGGDDILFGGGWFVACRRVLGGVV